MKDSDDNVVRLIFPPLKKKDPNNPVELSVIEIAEIYGKKKLNEKMSTTVIKKRMD